MKKKPKRSAKSEKRDQYHHEDLKNSLVREALFFLKKNRAEDLSLRDLARRLKVSHTAPYRHFATKEDLLAEIIRDGFTRLSAKFDAIQVDPRDQFQNIFAAHGAAYIRFIVESPDQARLMFSGLLCDPKRHQEAHEAGQGAFGRLLRLIEHAQKEGHIRKDDNPYLLGLMIWSSVHGSAMLMLENQFAMIDNAPEIQIEKYVEFMSARMLSGLR